VELVLKLVLELVHLATLLIVIATRGGDRGSLLAIMLAIMLAITLVRLDRRCGATVTSALTNKTCYSVSFVQYASDLVNSHTAGVGRRLLGVWAVVWLVPGGCGAQVGRADGRLTSLGV
jgi:hypothetical protein